MATTSPDQGLHGPLRLARRITGWYFAAAVLFTLSGMFAIIEPAVAGLGVTLLVGWLLVFGGVTHFVEAFKGGGAKRVVLQVLAGIVYLVGGLYCLRHPFLAIGTLTVLLAAVIIVGGMLEIVSYFRLRSEGASRWVLFNGLVGLVLGMMIMLHWPSSSVWAIGILVGVHLLTTGMTRLMFGMAIRRLA